MPQNNDQTQTIRYQMDSNGNIVLASTPLSTPGTVWNTIPTDRFQGIYLDDGLEENNDEASYLNVATAFINNITQEEAHKTFPFVKEDIPAYSPNDTIRAYKQFPDGSLLVLKHQGRYQSQGKNNAEKLAFFKSFLFIAYPIVTRFPGVMYDKKSLRFTVNSMDQTSELLILRGDHANCIQQVPPLNRYQIEVTDIRECRFTVTTAFLDESLVRRYITINELYHGYPISNHVEIPDPSRIIYYVQIFRNDVRMLLRQVEAAIRVRREVRSRKPNIHAVKFQSKRRGKYVTHDVPFSCEVECYGPNKETVAKVSQEIPKDFGICHDGSLKGNCGFPIEIQTPILSGKKGEIAIAEILCQKLVNYGFSAKDKTCGMHIHLDAGDLKMESPRPNKLLALYLFYRIFEDVIVSFLPSTRRANHYCAQFKDGVEYNGTVVNFDDINMTIKKIGHISSLEEFMHHWYKTKTMDQVSAITNSRYIPHRYFGINFHSLLAQNHLEIRYHSGTLNYEKILYWIDLHGNILQECANGNITEEMVKSLWKQMQGLSIQEQTKLMLDLLPLNPDTVEYLINRQETFEHAQASEEILIDKTKGFDAI